MNTKLSTEIKVGDFIKYGNAWGTVIQEPKQSPYRSDEVSIKVRQHASTTKRRGQAYKNTKTGEIVTTFEYRKTTKNQAK